MEGLELKAGNCGCGGLTGPGGAGTGDCCFTFSRVKKEGDSIHYFGNNTTPNTTKNYERGYKVRKDGDEIEVQMLDTRGPKNFKFGGFPPPPLTALTAKGWQAVSQYERDVEGTGEPLPEWCSSAESACERPLVEKETGKGDKR